MSDDLNLTDQDRSDDEVLLAQLAAAVRVHDPVPLAVVDAAKASLTWRTIDSDLAELASDSSVDESPVLVRGSATVSDVQLLTFETGRFTVDLQISARNGGRRLVGQLAPACVAEIEVRAAGSVVLQISSDELGRVPAIDVPAGPFSLRIRIAGEPSAVVTDWVTL